MSNLLSITWPYPKTIPQKLQLKSLKLECILYKLFCKKIEQSTESQFAHWKLQLNKTATTCSVNFKVNKLHIYLYDCFKSRLIDHQHYKKIYFGWKFHWIIRKCTRWYLVSDTRVHSNCAWQQSCAAGRERNRTWERFRLGELSQSPSCSNCSFR